MILNAMSFGKVVVASDSIGPRIYIRDGANGIIVRGGTADAWSAALRQAWRFDADAYRRIGGQARFDASVHFNEPMRMAHSRCRALRRRRSSSTRSLEKKDRARCYRARARWNDVYLTAPCGRSIKYASMFVGAAAVPVGVEDDLREVAVHRRVRLGPIPILVRRDLVRVRQVVDDGVGFQLQTPSPCGATTSGRCRCSPRQRCSSPSSPAC